MDTVRSTVRIIVRTTVLGAHLTRCIAIRLTGCLANMASDTHTPAPEIPAGAHLGEHVMSIDCSPAGQTGIAAVVSRRATGTMGPMR